MPYTPPAQQSPAASGLASPAYSRNSSFVGTQVQQQNGNSPPRSPGARPALPRSLSSTAYLQKHRRSPSLHNDSHVTSIPEDKDARPQHNLTINTSIRQSPPPVASDTVTPIGLMVSPPDSTQNSSDEEGPTSRPDVDPDNLVELQQAVRRSLSPDMGRSANVPTAPSEPVSGSNSDTSVPTPIAGPPRLTASARKISHSRSSTEASVLAAFTQSAAGSDAEDDDAQFDRPPLVRKKSGELVKPAIRPHKTGRSRKHASMPGTPRAVHFNDNMEQVRHFLQVDRPIAVSAGASPVDPMDDEAEFPFRFPSSHASSDWEIRLCNFPRESHERSTMPVRIERIFLSTDQRNLIGHVAAANISFHKQVVARFTFDSWKTTSEVVAEYNHDTRQKPREDGYDQFNFNIALTDQTKLESKTLMICARYNVSGQEHWDNNDSMNYKVEFLEKPKPRAEHKNATVSTPTSGTGAIPRSRHNSPAARPRSMPSFEDDFAVDFDTTTPLKLKPPKAILPDEPSRKTTAVGQAFGSRYDFGASLTAALTNAQATIADRSVRNARVSQPAAKPRPAPVPRSHGLGTDSPRPDSLIASNQTVDSKAYQDFVSKFCFYGSNIKPGNALTKPKAPAQNGDGTDDDKTGSEHVEVANGVGQNDSFDTSIISSPAFLSPNENPSSNDNSPLQHELSSHSLVFGFPFHQRTPPVLG